jgi:hypothetical protein
MNIQLVTVPYDSGHFNERMGRGPTHLASNGVPEALRSAGHDVGVETVEIDNRFPSEIGTAFELKREIAGAVGRAASNRRFPIVLAGSLTAYDPGFDRDGRALEACKRRLAKLTAVAHEK